MRPYLRAANVGWEGLRLDDVKEMDFTAEEFKTYGLREGDVLVGEASGSREEVGKSAVWRGEIPGACFQNTLIRIRCSDELLPEYLQLQLKRDAVSGALAKASRGVGIHHLGREAMANWRIVLPPLEEQHRIVGQVGALTASSRRTSVLLRQLPTLLDRLRQSVLAAAFRGDLTADWRAAHPDVEPASELLKRIRAERRRRWEEGVLARLTARGKPPADDRWKARYEAPDAPHDSAPPDLPAEWCWASVGEIALLGAGLTKNAEKRASATETVPIVSVAAVYMREIRRDGVGSIGLLPEDEDRGTLEAGDLLVVEGNGSLDQVGRVAIWRSEVPNARHQNHLIRLRSVMGDPQYLLEWLASPAGRKALEDEATSGAGLYTLSLSKVNRIPVPLAPMEEQAAITARLAERLRCVERLEWALQGASTLLSAVERAILSRALAGDPRRGTSDRDWA
jgi:type I restriction enzyme S subunit